MSECERERKGIGFVRGGRRKEPAKERRKWEERRGQQSPVLFVRSHAFVYGPNLPMQCAVGSGTQCAAASPFLAPLMCVGGG